MPSPRTTKAVKDDTDILHSTAKIASFKKAKRRVHDLSRHKEDPLGFLIELKRVLHVVDSARKYGIAWQSNEDGEDVLTLGDPLKFQKLLRKEHDRENSESTDALLEAFDKSMIRLRFEIRLFGSQSSNRNPSPRRYKNHFFIRNGSLQHLEWISGEKLASQRRQPAQWLGSSKDASQGAHKRRVTPEKNVSCPANKCTSKSLTDTCKVTARKEKVVRVTAKQGKRQLSELATEASDRATPFQSESREEKKDVSVKLTNAENPIQNDAKNAVGDSNENETKEKEVSQKCGEANNTATLISPALTNDNHRSDAATLVAATGTKSTVQSVSITQPVLDPMETKDAAASLFPSDENESDKPADQELDVSTVSQEATDAQARAVSKMSRDATEAHSSNGSKKSETESTLATRSTSKSSTKSPAGVETKSNGSRRPATEAATTGAPPNILGNTAAALESTEIHADAMSVYVSKVLTTSDEDDCDESTETESTLPPSSTTSDEDDSDESAEMEDMLPLSLTNDNPDVSVETEDTLPPSLSSDDPDESTEALDASVGTKVDCDGGELDTVDLAMNAESDSISGSSQPESHSLCSDTDNNSSFASHVSKVVAVHTPVGARDNLKDKTMSELHFEDAMDPRLDCGEAKPQEDTKVTDDEEEIPAPTAITNLDSIITQWKDNNPGALAKKWNGWESSKTSFIELKPRLWHPLQASKSDDSSCSYPQNKRMVLVLMSGRGNAKSVEEMILKKYTPQLRRETVRCLVLEKLLAAEVHALDKRTISNGCASPQYFHRGDINDLRRLSSSGLLKDKQFDEVVMDYAWWENAYVQDRITEAFFTDSLPKLLRCCKPTGSIFLPCTPYLFAQTVLAVLQEDEDVDAGMDDLNDQEVVKPKKCPEFSNATVSLLSQYEAADRISFWNATEVIKNNRYLMSKDPAGLIERIGMGEGQKEAMKKLRQVCSFLSNASVKFVLEQYKKLKVDKPLFIQVSRANAAKVPPKRARKDEWRTLSRAWETPAETCSKKRDGAPLNTEESKRSKIETNDFVGEHVYIGLGTIDGNEDRYHGTIHRKRRVLGQDVYDVEFDQDKTLFSYTEKAVKEGIEMYTKQRQHAKESSCIIDIEYL